MNALDRARQAGEVREPRRTDVRFDAVPRASVGHSTRDILDDLRGDR